MKIYKRWAGLVLGMFILRTQNSELRKLFIYQVLSGITFHILNKYIKLIYSFGLGKHLLRQDIVTGTDATQGCFKQNSFTIHIRLISVQIHVQLLG